MRELREGLWHWQAPHPEWSPEEGWPQRVSSYAFDDGERLMLFDPLAVPAELEERTRSRDTIVVLTAPWHERDTRSLVERLGVAVVTPPADTEDDLMKKFGVTRERAAGGSPDLEWLREATWVAGGAVLRSASRCSRGAHGEPTGRDALERALSA